MTNGPALAGPFYFRYVTLSLSKGVLRRLRLAQPDISYQRIKGPAWVSSASCSQ